MYHILLTNFVDAPNDITIKPDHHDAKLPQRKNLFDRHTV